MPGKRISELTALSGAASANNDDLLIFDSGAGETKRISRSQLAEGMVDDLPLQYYLGVLNANPTQRLNGDALQIGDFYLDAVTKYTTVYNGSGWNSYASVIAAQAAAEVAQAAAEAAQTAAETAETNAETAETNAETAEAGAVAARVAAEAAQTGAELAETNAETARDAAFVNADVYADIATGRAAVADGEQFMVVSGGEIVRYRRDTSTTQTEVARMKSASAVDGIFDDVTKRDDAVKLAFFTGAAEVFARGDNTEPPGTISASLKGWRAPFKHNGTAFDAVQLTLRAGAADTPFIVRIMNSARTTEIARGFGRVGTTSTLVTVALNKIVRSLALNDIAYISYEPAEAGGFLSYPGGHGTNNYPAGDADPTVYPEQYLNTSNVWLNAGPAGNYCIQFRAFNISDTIDLAHVTSINAATADLLDLVTGTSVVTYDLPGYTGHDTTYTQDGLGTQMPAQSQAVSFNKVTVYGGASGAGKLRGYLVDPATSGTHVPASDATLLFAADIDWTLDVVAREVVLDASYTVPVGKELHILWVANTAVDVSIARWSTDPDGVLPRLRLSLTGVGDETGIWSETWYDGSAAFFTVPPKLELVAVSAVVPAPTTVEPYFTIPNTVNAVVGTEICLQYDSVCSAHSIGLTGLVGYSCAIVGPKGKNEERFWRYTPVSGDVGNHTLTAKLFDATGALVTAKEFTVSVHAATAPVAAKNILTIGDSLTAPGTITATVQAKFAGLGATVPTFVGSQGTAPANHEGYGGRTFGAFASAGTNVYRVTVSGVSAVSVGAVYLTGGINYTVSEVNLVGGAGDLLLSGASAPASSGTLTYVSGTGDATISYSAVVTENTNPFWNPGTSQLDIANYRTNESIAAVIDVVTMQLGINDVFGEGGRTDAQLTTIIGYAQDLIDAFIADNASCQIVIVLPSLCGNTSDGFAANYGAAYSREVYEATMFRFRTALLDAFDGGAYHANVTIGSGGLSIDRYYGYGRSSAAVSARITDTVSKHNNAVHPITVGYQQIGDANFCDVMAVI